jgi:hypothetical protein
VIGFHEDPSGSNSGSHCYFKKQPETMAEIDCAIKAVAAMPFRHVTIYLLAFCALCAPLFGQNASKPSTSADDFDLPALTSETQHLLNVPGYFGMVWWIPTQYWELVSERAGMSEEKSKERFAALRKYTVVVVVVGKTGIGNINYISEPEVRDATTLRDSDGTVYQSVQKLSGDAEGLLAVMKAVFPKIMGTMGQNMQILFFPATNKMAKPIADPLSPGGFSVTLSKIVGDKDKVVEWKLPLTTLSPPKYCPVGKERVQANWIYCPWHGVKLDTEAPIPTSK